MNDDNDQIIRFPGMKEATDREAPMTAQQQIYFYMHCDLLHKGRRVTALRRFIHPKSREMFVAHVKAATSDADAFMLQTFESVSFYAEINASDLLLSTQSAPVVSRLAASLLSGCMGGLLTAAMMYLLR